MATLAAFFAESLLLGRFADPGRTCLCRTRDGVDLRLLGRITGGVRGVRVLLAVIGGVRVGGAGSVSQSGTGRSGPAGACTSAPAAGTSPAVGTSSRTGSITSVVSPGRRSPTTAENHLTPGCRSTDWPGIPTIRP